MPYLPTKQQPYPLHRPKLCVLAAGCTNPAVERMGAGGVPCDGGGAAPLCQLDMWGNVPMPPP